MAVKSIRALRAAHDGGRYHYRYGSATPNVTIASQTSGPAPLPVTYDVTRDATITPPANNGSGSPAWETAIVSVNYGDGAAGTWTHTGLSKNTDRNIQGGHVYESVGTYTLSVDVIYSDGSTFTGEQTITVTDPEVVYAGVTFYADHTLGNDTTGDGSIGNPWKTSDKLFDIVFASNGPRRGLLKKGETFVALANKSYTTALVGPFHIGAYGSGANPIISKSSANEVLALGNGMTAGARIVDVDLSLAGTAAGWRTGSNCLFLRCDVADPESAWTTSSAHLEKQYTIIQECDITGQTDKGIYWQWGYRSAILGCHVTTPDAGTGTNHCIRAYLSHSSIKHNLFSGGSTGGSLLKFVGWDDVGLGGGHSTEAAEYTIIADNIADGSHPLTLAQYFTFRPSNTSSVERIINCVWERNYLKSAATTGSQQMMDGSCEYCTFRNNRLDGSAESGTTGIRLSREGAEPIPVGNMILHNSFFHTGTMNPVSIFNTTPGLLNTGFGSDTGWQHGVTWVIAAGVATKTAGDTDPIFQSSTQTSPDLIVGHSYTVTFTITAWTAGTLTASCGTANGTPRGSAATFVETIVCAGNTTFSLTPSSDFAGAIDNATCVAQNNPIDTVVKNNHAMTASGTSLITTDQGTGTIDVGNTRSTVGFTDPANNDWTPTATILETVTTLAEARDDFVGTVRGAVGAACDSGSLEA